MASAGFNDPLNKHRIVRVTPEQYDEISRIIRKRDVNANISNVNRDVLYVVCGIIAEPGVEYELRVENGFRAEGYDR